MSLVVHRTRQPARVIRKFIVWRTKYNDYELYYYSELRVRDVRNPTTVEHFEDIRSLSFPSPTTHNADTDIITLLN
jgi:hypothetical protein